MKNIFKILIFTALAVFSLSCKEWEEEKPTIDEPAVFSLASEFDGELIEVLEPNSKTISVQLFAESVSDQNLEISLAVNPDLVAEYNKANSTDYTLLAADAYEIPDTPLYLPRYNKKSSLINIRLKTETLPDENLYLLPLTIGKVEGTDNYRLSEEKKNVFIIFKKKAVPMPAVLERDNWKIIYCDSWSKDSSGNGHPERMLDGDNLTYWGYDSKTPKYVPITFIVDLGAEKTLRSFLFTSRIRPANGNPWGPTARATFEFSNKLSDLPTDQAEIEDVDLPKGMVAADWTGLESFDETVLTAVVDQKGDFNEPHNARYVKVTILKGWNGNGSYSVGYNGAQMAEIGFMGHETPLEF